jgi:hypothetical protein
MTNMNRKLSEVFDIELTNTDKSIEELKISAKVDDIDSLEKQREYVKKNLVALIEKGNTLFDNVSAVATSSEEAKDFEAATKIMKTLVDTNMTLLDCEVVHKPNVINTETDNSNTSSENIVFSGSTNDLSKYIKSLAISNSIELVDIKKD